MVTGDHEQGQAEAAEERSRALVLFAPAAMGQVAARDDQLDLDSLEQVRDRLFDAGVLVRTRVEIREVENPRGHAEPRYTLRAVREDSAEIFDDLYLGVRAGGALRKQRRGEPLTMEEQEAIGRWQRLSTWRKAVAIGSFAVGTFGLGFTLGGLVFGRWRKA